MDINENVKQIIKEVNQVDLSEEETQSVMDRILGLGQWEEVRNGLLNILFENDTSLWDETIRYMYFFQGRELNYEAEKTIALLYNCLILSEDLNENLIWTITIDIKSVNYLSEYDPFKDAGVLKEMERIKRERGL